MPNVSGRGALESAMEDFYIDIMIGAGEGSRSVHLELPPFTLIGATTRAGMLKSTTGTFWDYRPYGVLCPC